MVFAKIGRGPTKCCRVMPAMKSSINIMKSKGRPPAVGDTFTFRPRLILAPVDFSDPNRFALRYTALLAKEYGARVRLLYVAEPAPYPEFGYAHLATKELRLKRLAGERLQAIRGNAPLKSIPRVDIAIRHGRASAEIVEEAADCQADLIVLATHGYSGLFHVMMGSTAEKVVRHARCPVLTIRTPGTAMV